MSQIDDLKPVSNPAYRVAEILFENSVFLIVGASAGLLWANLDGASYQGLLHTSLLPGSSEAGYSLLKVVNDGLMAFFFAIAAKEVWESLLPGGSLSQWKLAATPLIATLGGVVVPACVYLLGCLLTGQLQLAGRGWAIPCATDIAFSYLIARIVFGPGHPAIAFLLLLAIADDAAGLLILAVAYPTETLNPQWLLIAMIAVLLGIALRRYGVRNFWWYLLGPGVLSWVAFHHAGIHPALALVPIIPTMPHAKTDLGLFTISENGEQDALNAFEKWWKNPVELILGLFGLVNAGVVITHFGTTTWLVLAGLLLGKPLGIISFTWFGTRFLKLQLPAGIGFRHIITLGIVAGVGFTVALFVTTAAFPEPGPIQDAAKMGALGSFLAACIAIPVGRLLGVRWDSDRQ